MARGRFVAAFFSNCSECEEVIEPGDNAGYVRDISGAVCAECLEEFDDEDYPELDRWDEVR